MRKGVRLIKRLVALSLVILLSIESFAAVVGDNDGAAFITKAEFDSLKSTFQEQINRYNQSIDNKIDGAIAGYLDGIKTQRIEKTALKLWGGRKLGLLENTKSRPYVEGIVGGTITLGALVANAAGSGWQTGNSSTSSSKSIGQAYWLSYCFHKMSSIEKPFKYAIVECGKKGSDFVFDLQGYCSVEETMTSTLNTLKNADYTAEGEYSIGLCTGVVPKRWDLSTDRSSYSGVMVHLCELKKTENYTRGADGKPRHNLHDLLWEKTTLSSKYNVESGYCYVTNVANSSVYTGIRVPEWTGINLTSDSTEIHTSGELASFGWTLPSPGDAENFHLKINNSNGSAYGCGQGAWVRLITGDDGYGNAGSVPTTNPHGTVSDDNAFKRWYKADLSDDCNVNNIYSSEIASVIIDNLPKKLNNGIFDGTERNLAPLYMGLPLVDVKAGEIVDITLGLLDDADYSIGFTIDGFENESLDQSSFSDASCNVEGSTNHIVSVTGPEMSKKIRINIEKSGVLFLKYGATGGSSQLIQLPKTCDITKQ